MAPFRIRAVQTVLDEIEQRPAARFERVRRQQIVPDDRSHHWRGGKIKGRCAKHRNCRLTWIDVAKLAGRYAVGDQAGKELEERLEIFAGDPFNFSRGVHRLPLREAWILWMRREKIEVPVPPGVQPVAGRGIGRGRRVNYFAQ